MKETHSDYSCVPHPCPEDTLPQLHSRIHATWPMNIFQFSTPVCASIHQPHPPEPQEPGEDISVCLATGEPAQPSGEVCTQPAEGLGTKCQTVWLKQCTCVLPLQKLDATVFHRRQCSWSILPCTHILCFLPDFHSNQKPTCWHYKFDFNFTTSFQTFPPNRLTFSGTRGSDSNTQISRPILLSHCLKFLTLKSCYNWFFFC